MPLKFKYAVILLNVMTLLFLGVLAASPFLLPGGGAETAFLRLSWLSGALLFLVLLGADIYFALNGRIFTLLEKEDWPALVRELEKRTAGGRYGARLIKLLINSYMALSDPGAVNLLEKKLAVVKPALVNSNALVFGAARILTRDHAGALSFFKDRLDGPGADKDWTRWYYAFVLLLEREFMPAADQFILLAGGSGNGLVTGLSAFLLSGTLAQFLPDRREEFLLFAGRGRDRVKRRVRTRSAWDRGLKRVETEIHVVILAAYTGKAADYIYGDAK